jgi:hypothetical protein
MPCTSLDILDFSKDLVSEKLGESYTAKYLFSYLTTLNAKSAICEGHYVDRHYLDDFAQYYSRSFNAPVAYCQRLHFFSVNREQLDQQLNHACKGIQERGQAEQELCEHYLGFVVIRPLVDAKVGRAVLRTYPLDGLRRYTVVRHYRVHLAGLRLSVDGLAYQEQDQGTAVCASIALWSALQRVAYVSGHRTPTPSTITKAAKSPFPASSGLTYSQMATALNSLGYLADLFTPAENRSQFRAKVVACLESQLPVILLLSGSTGGHAVTVTGFRQSQNIVDVPISATEIDPVRMKSGSLEVIYVHDDNLGPYAHYELFDVDEQDDSGYKLLKLRRGRTNIEESEWWPVDEWTIYAALVPKNEKMRLSIEELFSNLLEVHRISEFIFQGLELHYGVKFSSGVDYKRSLFDLSFEPQALRRFLSDLTLPRYVGVAQINTEEQHLCDAIIDISEVNRGNPSILGFVAPGVPENSVAWQRLLYVIQYLNQSSQCQLLAVTSTLL